MDSSDVELAIGSAHRSEWARLLATTMQMTRDIDVAEECVQEAYAEALVTWNRDGVPNNPGAWLTIAARRRAVDVLRRETTFRSKMPLLIDDDERDEGNAMAGSNDLGRDDWSREGSDVVQDQRLRLIFMCCHPALNQEAQLALTLRLVCGMSTPDIARSMLVSPSTMSARLTRAKKKISIARIRVGVPKESELPDRLRPVLGVIYLLFTSGHTAPSGDSLLRIDLIDESILLARMLRTLMPDEPEVAGLLGLLLVNDARRDARLGARGEPLRLDEQDRSTWNQFTIDEARELIEFSMRRSRPGRYALQGAIALLYAEAPAFDETNWLQIRHLYDELLLVWPSPVVALNRAVVTSKTSGPHVALQEVEALELDERLANYHYLYSIKADLLSQLGRTSEANEEFQRAAELSTNEAERKYLNSRVVVS
jgi:RNA polymerase sigma factor (sigma-70 family)